MKLLGNYLNKDGRFKPGDLSERRNVLVNDTGILEKEISKCSERKSNLELLFFPCFCHVSLKCRDMIQVVDTKKPVCLYIGLTQINSQNFALGSGIEKHQDKPFCNGLQFHSSSMNLK